MKTKTWYVTMQQREIEAFTNPYERLVYEAVKSFCGNGTIEREASYTEIAKRGNVSKMTVGRYLPLLIDKGLIEIVKTAKRIGGTVNVYKISPEFCKRVTGSSLLLRKGISQRDESVTPSCESVTDAGINPSNIKKEKIHIFSYKRQKQSNMAGFSPEIKDRLFGYAEAISMKGRLP